MGYTEKKKTGQVLAEGKSGIALASKICLKLFYEYELTLWLHQKQSCG